MEYADEIYAERAHGYEEMQLMLATKSKCDGPEQLWMRLSQHSNNFSNLNLPTKDDFCTLTLVAGSVDIHDFQSCTDVCVNGSAYTAYAFAAMQPELWKYNPDRLLVHKGSLKKLQYHVLEFHHRQGQSTATNEKLG